MRNRGGPSPLPSIWSVGRSVQVLEGICIGQIFHFTLFLPTYRTLCSYGTRYSGDGHSMDAERALAINRQRLPARRADCLSTWAHSRFGSGEIATHSGVRAKTAHRVGFIHIKGFRVGTLTEYTARGYQVVWGWSKIGYDI